jgi:hypothetical protein
MRSGFCHRGDGDAMIVQWGCEQSAHYEAKPPGEAAATPGASNNQLEDDAFAVRPSGGLAAPQQPDSGTRWRLEASASSERRFSSL